MKEVFLNIADELFQSTFQSSTKTNPIGQFIIIRDYMCLCAVALTAP